MYIPEDKIQYILTYFTVKKSTLRLSAGFSYFLNTLSCLLVSQ